MKKAAFFVLPSIVLISQVSLHAQVYTQNLVGYVNFDFYAGVNLFANPLDFPRLRSGSSAERHRGCFVECCFG